MKTTNKEICFQFLMFLELLNNLKISEMKEQHLTPEQIILHAEYRKQQEIDYQIDKLINTIAIDNFIEDELYLMDIMEDFKELLKYKYPYESKGDNLKGNLQFTKYVQSELKKGRSKESLLIELKGN